MSLLLGAASAFAPSSIRQAVARRYSSSSTRLLALNNRLLEVGQLRNTYCALRHGRSLANEAKLISSHPDVATIQHGLSKTGKGQAEQAGLDLVDKFNNSNAGAWDGICILTSDYLRAKETAQFSAEAVVNANLPLFEEDIIIETRLRERWFGEWDGGSDQHYPDVWKDDLIDADHTLRGVESVNSVMDRTTECVLEWDNSILQNHLIVLVAHGDVLQITQTAFAKLDGTKHRSLEHLETATLRPLELRRLARPDE